MTKPGAGEEARKGAVVAKGRINVGNIKEREKATARDAGADETSVETTLVLLAFKLRLGVAQLL